MLLTDQQQHVDVDCLTLTKNSQHPLR